MKFRKKPVVIEAVRFNLTNRQEVLDFIGKAGHWSDDGREIKITIYTLEGNITASEGDWIIKGVKGEFYPCKPDIFAATYEAVESPPQQEQG
jgi:hypothetical protein